MEQIEPAGEVSSGTGLPGGSTPPAQVEQPATAFNAQAAPAPAGAQPDQPTIRVTLARAFGEIGAVYIASFGLGVLSALALLNNPTLGGDQQVHTFVEAGDEMLQYIMQASVVVFGVGYFSLRRGLTLRSIFGRFIPAPPRSVLWPTYPGAYQNGAYVSGPHQYGYAPAAAAGAGVAPPIPGGVVGATPAWGQPIPTAPPAVSPTWNGYGGYPHQGYYAPAPQPPAQRGPAWQFSRAFFLSTAGVLAFLVTILVYDWSTGGQSAAPDPGHSLWMIPVGLVIALAAGVGEEMLITGMVVTTLEQAGFARRAWVIYLVAIALRIPFHLYYGWASLGVICFTAVNVWVYRRWRVLWPIVLAHAVYDAVQFAGSLVPTLAGLVLLALGLSTFVMMIVIAAVELSDRSARRRVAAWQASVGG